MGELHAYGGLRFMTRFQCLGSACEDPCCRQWQIPVDEVHFRMMAAALGDSVEGKGELARAVRRLPVVDQHADRMGDMALGDDGHCVMLESDNLCSLHRRFGEDVLPDQCATYPRSIGRLGDQLEMSGATSCPEVARLCLLVDDGVDVVAFEPARFARRVFAHEVADPDQGRFREVRDLMLALLRRPYPMASREMFLATFAHQAAADGARLDETLATFADPDVLERLHQAFVAAPLDEVFAVAVVLGVLEAERWPPASNFGRLVERITSRYATARKKGVLDPRLVAKLFRKRRGELPAHLIARLDMQLRNYAINDLYQDWSTDSSSLVDQVQLHLVQMAMIRFLIISHPATSAACREPAAVGLAHLDGAVIECVSYFSRAAHHTGGLGARIMRRLAEGGMTTPDHSFSLARM